MLDPATLKAIGRQLQNLYGVLPRPTGPDAPAGMRDAGRLRQQPGVTLLGQAGASSQHDRGGRSR